MQYPSSAQLQNLAPSFILGGVRLDIIHTSRRKRRGCLTSSVISACCANISIETSIFFCPRVKKIYQGSEIEPPQKSPLSWPPDLGLVARPPALRPPRHSRLSRGCDFSLPSSGNRAPRESGRRTRETRRRLNQPSPSLFWCCFLFLRKLQKE